MRSIYLRERCLEKIHFLILLEWIKWWVTGERAAKYQSRGKKNKDLKWETKGHQYFEESTHTAWGQEEGQVEEE